MTSAPGWFCCSFVVTYLNVVYLSQKTFPESLDRELCWYLTCERRDMFKGDASVTLPSNASHFILMAIVVIALAVLLGIVYYLVWFCFWQLELSQRQTSSNETSADESRRWSTLLWQNVEQKRQKSTSKDRASLKRRHDSVTWRDV